MKEQWKPVVGYEGHYDVSDCGRVRSHKSYFGRPCSTPHLLAQRLTAKGRLDVNLCLVGHLKRRLVHQLVLESFVGPCPSGFEACHEDDNPENNRLTNLKWDSRSHNIKQMWDRNRRSREHMIALGRSNYKHGRYSIYGAVI